MIEWLKIENLIGKLNLSGWFRGWFKHENNIQINFLEVTVEKIKPGEVPAPVVLTVVDEWEFTPEEKFLIDKVNQIHRLNGSAYNFENSYKLALQNIRKPHELPDWYISPASHLANIIQSGDIELGIEIFFKSFKVEEDPKIIGEFSGLKDRVRYSYKRLQNLRHVDKSGELKGEMISEYRKKIAGKEEITDEDCEEIFADFQKLLLELFRKYEIKINL